MSAAPTAPAAPAAPAAARLATWELRAAFARSLSTMYGREVPAYPTLVEVAGAVNADVLARDGAAARRLGSPARVTAERHGAIRVGTPAELAQVGRVFGAFGMHPVGFYDLRDAPGSPVPVVSTAFRPTDPTELARNPFRVFTSVLVTGDRRFFDADLQARVEARLSRRELFGPELLALADRARDGGGLPGPDGARLLELATAAFELSRGPVDRAWYAELSAVSPVAADIAGVDRTHINHLTPRVLDIDDLYARMQARGIAMIDEIQGPPRWAGPDVLLRQTSFRALAEPRRFRDANGSVSTGELRVRFGEVEQRGVALTPRGRDRYDAMTAEVDHAVAGGADRADAAGQVWRASLPDSEAGLERDGLGFFTYRLVGDPGAALTLLDREARSGDGSGADLALLVAHGQVSADPVVYEDFLPRSAAGIFASNLDRADDTDGSGGTGTLAPGPELDLDWVSGVLGTRVADPAEHCAAQRRASLAALAAALGRDPATLVPPDDPTPDQSTRPRTVEDPA